MTSRKIYILLVCGFCLAVQTNGSFLDWIWPNRNVEIFRPSLQLNNLPSINFELSETDEKFIEDSSKLLGRKLSKSDFCQQRVVLNLKTSCKSLTDEQLRRLSVDLFNCQLHSESKTSHECSENMPLEECTSQMSPEEKSSYAQIYGQAKQLCLSIRQDQFRGLTELTINKLVSSTHQHLDLMEKLQNSQKLLEKATLTSLDEITDSHLKLLDQQQEILKMSEFQKHNSEQNMREILKEKSLLKIGNSELNSFIFNLKQKVKEGKDDYSSLVSDLEQLNAISSRITLKLEEITEEISERGEENYALLETTKRQIEQVDEVVEEVFNFVMALRKEFNEKVRWLEKYLGKDEGIERLTIILIHLGTLFIGMLCLVFVGADYVSRYLFLGLIGVNATLTLTKVYNLNVGILMKTIAVLLIGNLGTIIYKKYNLEKIWKTYYAKLKQFFLKKPNTPNRDSNFQVGSGSSRPTSVNRREDLNLSNGHTSVDRHRFHLISHAANDSLNLARMRRSSDEREGSVASTVSSRRSSGGFQQCSATTLKGSQCSMTSHNASGLCTVHSRASRDRER
ncbi:hypothetical protein ACFFRR_004336 [Megaselia abdita]